MQDTFYGLGERATQGTATPAGVRPARPHPLQSRGLPSTPTPRATRGRNLSEGPDLHRTGEQGGWKQL